MAKLTLTKSPKITLTKNPTPTITMPMARDARTVMGQGNTFLPLAPAEIEKPKFTLPEPTYKAVRSAVAENSTAGGFAKAATPPPALSGPSILPSAKMEQAVAEKQASDSAKELARLLSYDVNAAEKEISALKLNRNAEKMQNIPAAGSGTKGTFQTSTLPVSDAATSVQDRIDSLQRETAKAKKTQSQMRYSALPGASDFAKYAAEGAAIKNPSVQDAERGVSIAGWKPFAEKVGNVVTYSRDNYGKLTDVNDVKYHYMTDEEVSIYNYLLEKEGKDSAKEYLDYLEEDLNSRLGAVQAKGIRDIENPIGRTLATGWYGSMAGLDQNASGLRQLASEERQPTSTTQFGSAYVREDLKDTGPKVLGRSLGQIGYDLVNTGANMAPAILIGAATGGAGLPAALAGGIGAAAVALPAAGNAYNQALGEGYGSDEARNYAALVGASEGALQYLLGGIGALGGKLTGNVAKSTLQNIDNALLRVAGTLGIKMAGEGTEEYLQEILEPVFRNLAFNENNEFKPVTEDALYSALLGALTAGVAEVGGVVQTETAPSQASVANSAIDSAYSTMAERGMFAPETTGAVQNTNRALGLPTWSEAAGSRVSMMPGATRETPSTPPETPAVDNVVDASPASVNAAVDNNSNVQRVADTIPTTGAQQVTPPQSGGDSVGAAKAGFDPYSQLQNAKSEFHPDGEQAARVVDVPTTDLEGRNIPKSTATVMEAEVTPDSAVGVLQDAIAQGKFFFDTITDNDAQTWAQRTIQGKGWEGALEYWKSNTDNGVSGKNLVALGQNLLKNAMDIGDGNAIVDIMLGYTRTSTQSAQSMQAQRMLKKMSPEWKLVAVQRTVNLLNEAQTPNNKNKQRNEKVKTDVGADVKQTVEKEASLSTGGRGAAPAADKPSAWARDTSHDNGIPVGKWMRTVGERLSELLSKRMEPAKIKEQPITTTILNDLVSFAEEHALPKQEKTQRRTATDRIRDWLNNKNQYAIAWNEAQLKIREKYKDNPGALSQFDEWIDSTIGYNADPMHDDINMMRAVVQAALDSDYTIKSLIENMAIGNEGAVREVARQLIENVGPQHEGDKVRLTDAVTRYLNEKAAGTNSNAIVQRQIKAILKDVDVKLTDAAAFTKQSKEQLQHTITNLLINKYNVGETDAQTVSQTVGDEYQKMILDAAERRMKQLYGDKTNSKGEKVVRTFIDRLHEAINLGALTNETYSDAAQKALFGSDKYSVTIDPALIKEFSNAEPGKAQDAVLDKIYKNIAEQIPSTPMDKFTALRYLNMLGNLKTQVRNIAGNAFMQPVRIVKDKIGAVLERVAGVKKENRTKSFLYAPSLYSAASKDYDNVRSAALGEEKYAMSSVSGTQAIDQQRTIFKNNGTWGTLPDSPMAAKAARKATDVLWMLPEGMRRLTNLAMEEGDVFFSRFTYADALAGFLSARGVNAEQLKNGTVDSNLLDTARAYAIREAQRGTYRDSNQFSDMIANIGFRNADTTAKKAANMVLQGTLPFRRTPANVLVRGEEYSPLGIINTAVKSAQMAKGNENVTGADVIDSLSASLTGTGLFVLGMTLFSNGMLSGGPDDDDKQAALDDLSGKQSYALTIPSGESFTLDWLSPVSIPLFMGVEFAKNGLEDGYSFGDLMKSASSITDPMLQMSMMQGVNDQLSRVSYSENPLIDLTLNSLLGYMTQGLTSTLGGQFERTAEEDRMTTFTDKNSAISSDQQFNLGKMSAKTPGWDFQQIPYIDAWGRKESTGTLPTRAIQNFFLPGYLGKDNTTDADREIQRLLSMNVSENVVPSRASNTLTVRGVGETINLTSKQYEDYATKLGQERLALVNDLVKNDGYLSMTDEEKAKTISKAYDYALQIAGKTIKHEYEQEKWVVKAQNAQQELGLSTAEYLVFYNKYGGDVTNSDVIRNAYRAGLDPMDYAEYQSKAQGYNADGKGGLTIGETATAIASSGLSQKQQETLWLVNYPEWEEKSKKAGITTTEYINYKSITAGYSKKADKINVLRESGMTYNEALQIYNKVEN